MTEKFLNWRPHPWHGLEAGDCIAGIVTAFIEITPFDLVKYEVDKATGYLRVDRLHKTSSLPPTLYGFIPQTYCAEKVAALMPAIGRGPRRGVGDEQQPGGFLTAHRSLAL